MKKKSKRKQRLRRKSIQWLPPTKFWMMPIDQLAYYIASTARSTKQAIARINTLYDKSGVCNKASSLYHPEFCIQRIALIDKVKQYMSLNVTEAKAKKMKRWLQQVRPKWHPPEGLFTRDAEEIAATLANSSDSYKQAVARANFYYNRGGFCNPKSSRYDPGECGKRDQVLDRLRGLMNEATKDNILDYSGTNKLLFKIAQAFRTPISLAWIIYDLEDPDDYEETERLPIIRARFNTAFNNLTHLVGLCKVNSPLYRAEICKNLTKIRRQTWRIYYNLVLDSWGHERKHIKELPDGSPEVGSDGGM